jgi:hypothetical protein
VVVEPKRMSMVTEAPKVQKAGDVPTVERALPRRKEVCPPGWRVNELVSNVSGLFAEGVPPGPPSDQTAGPPETMLQGAAQAGAVVEPVFVPGNRTWQGDCVHVMELPPLFLMVSETATGEELAVAPAFMDTWTTAMLEFAVELLTRLYTEALTTPPTPKTAAIMMNRSMLWEIAVRRPSIFISRKRGPGL